MSNTLQVQVQHSAAKGYQTETWDKNTARTFAALVSGQGDGRVSGDDSLALARTVTDGNKYTASEKAPARFFLHACDDRYSTKVKVDGKAYDVRLTDPAEGSLKHEFAVFWGRLGARAKAAKQAAAAAYAGAPVSQAAQASVAAQATQAPFAAQSGQAPVAQS
jgi:hypothetical protein